MQVEDVRDLSEINLQYRVPLHLQSCHIAIVDGFAVSGHVPIAEIDRMLTERPEIAGLAVPGMPIGSPGMEVPNQTSQPFDVIAFDASGATEVYASYRP